MRGKIAANCCIQIGNEVNTKNTPLKNCRIITIGETTADAPRPLLGTTENAIPSTVEQALPMMTSQVKFHQREASVGRFKSNITDPKKSNNAVCRIINIVTSKALPIKYEDTDIGVPRSLFKVPESLSIGIVIASC